MLPGLKQLRLYWVYVLIQISYWTEPWAEGLAWRTVGLRLDKQFSWCGSLECLALDRAALHCAT